MSKPYTLTTPCKDCPFRTDVAPFLSHDRARSIADDCSESANFYCHKTVDYDSDDGASTISGRARVCAGFLITMERENRANQATRVAERLGMYDSAALDHDAPVHDSMEEWVASHERE